MKTLALATLWVLSLACSRPDTAAPATPGPDGSTAPIPGPATTPEGAVAPTPPAGMVPAEPKPTPPRVEVATFQVPGLDALVATKLAGALAAVPGVTVARPRIAEGRFEVEFTPPSATPDLVGSALKAIAPAATLEAVKAVEGGAVPASGCGGCPLKDSCAGHAAAEAHGAPAVPTTPPAPAPAAAPEGTR